MNTFSSPRASRKNVGTLLAVAVLGLSSFSPRAFADQTKANNADDLDLTTSWVSGVVPTTTDIAIFDSTLSGAFTSFSTGTSGTAPSWLGIKITNPAAGLFITGSAQALTLGASGIDMRAATQDLTITSNLALGANQAWNVAAGRTLTVGTIGGTGITGTANVTKSGAGTLSIFGTNNTFTGVLNVGNGVAALNFDSANGVTTNILNPAGSITLSGGKISVAGGGAQTSARLTLSTGASQIAVAAGNTLTLSAVTKAGSGGLGTVQGAALMFVPDAGGLSNVVLPGSLNQILLRDDATNPYATFGRDDWAATDATGNVIKATYTAATTALTANVNNDILGNFSTATVDVASDRFSDAAAAHIMTVTGTHTARGILVTSTSLGGTITGGTVRPNRNNTGGAALSIIQNSTNGDLTIASALGLASSSTPYHLVKSGLGRLILSNAGNTYNGPTDINEGILNPISNGALGAPATAAAINLNGGTLQATTDLALYNGTPGTNNRPVAVTDKGGTIEVQSGKTVTLPGVLSGVGVLSKTGPGLLDLSNIANTISGGIVVNNGNLRLSNVSGNVTGTAPVTINSTGILEGSGISTSAVTVNSGGHIAPGVVGVNSSIGTISFGALTLTNNSVIDLDVAAASNDIINITANGLNIQSGIKLNLFAAGTSNPYAVNQTFNVFNITAGTIPSNVDLQNDFTILNPATGTPTYTWGQSGTFITLTIAGLPVPTTWQVNGGGNWDVNGNWTAGAPAGAGATATFGPALLPGNTANISLNGSNRTAGLIVFNNPTASYTISASGAESLILDNGVNNTSITASGSHNISAPITLLSDLTATASLAGDTLTLSGNINGPTKNLTVTGSGRVILSGASDAYANTTIASGATLQIGAGGTTGTLGSGPVAVTGTLAFGHSDTFSVSNLISGTGSVVQNGTGVLSLTNVANAFTGLTINAGTVQLAPGSSTGNTLVVNGGTLDLSDQSRTVTAFSGTGGTVDNLTGTGSTTLTVNHLAGSTYAGRFNNTAGTLNLVLSGTGTFTAAGTTGTISGTVVVNGGALAIGATGALGNATLVTINQSGGATLAINDGVTFDRNVLLDGTSANEFMTSPANASATYSGILAITATQQFRMGIPTTSTLTITGAINSTANSFLFLSHGNFIFAGSGKIDGISQLAIGRSTSGGGQQVTSVVFKDNAVVTTPGAALAAAGNGVTNTTVTATIQDNAFLNLGTSGFELNGSGAATTLNLNGGSITFGTFFKANAAASVVNLNGTLLKPSATGAFLFAGANATTSAAGLTVNIGAGGGKILFDGQSLAVSQSMNGTADGGLALTATANGGTLALTGANTYQGPTSLATGVQLQFGTSTSNAANSISTITGNGNVAVAAGTTLTSDAVAANTLQIDGTHTLRANGTTVTTSVVNTLAIAGVPTAWTGKLQINNHVVIVNTANGTASKADVITALNDQVKQGVTGTANGITSATVIADPTHKATYVVDNALLGLTNTVEGVPVTAASVIVEATYQGDANLDRKVNVTDLGVLATFYGQNVTGFGIVRGDFNGDGLVNVSDLGILATDYGLGTAPGSTFSLQADLAQFPTLAAAAAAVPEPASLAVLAVGAGALLSRRRRAKA